MTSKSTFATCAWRRTALTALVAAATSIVPAVASAGECPAANRVADGQGQKPGPMAPHGLTDVVRATTDLSKEPLALDGRLSAPGSSICSPAE